MKYPVFLYKKEYIIRKVTLGNVIYNVKDRTELNFVDSFYNIADLISYFVKNINEDCHLIDYEGKKYPYETICNIITKKIKNNKNYKHRNGPVPNIKKKHWIVSMFRKPKTRNEIIQNEDFKLLKNEYKIKGKQRKLPTFWDDIWKNSLDNKNWKKFRNTQYKTNNRRRE